ncbi:hypothetical protein D9M71_431090 [compost metagenome]
MHQLQAFDPTRDHAADWQVDRRAALDGAVEDLAVDQFAFVVNSHHVAGFRLWAFGFLDHLVLQAGSGGDHAFFLAVFFQEFLAGGRSFFTHLGQALFGTLLQRSKGFYQLFVLELLFFLADSIFDALGDSLGIQVIHAFLRQALAHIQADAIGGFLRRGFQLYAGLRIATRENQANQGNRRRQPMLFHAISLFIRQ